MSPSTLLWAEEFGTPGPPDPASWTARHDANGGNDELEVYTPRPQNLTVDRQGRLALTAHRETYTSPAVPGVRAAQTRHFTSGRLESRGKREFTPPVRVEARIALPQVADPTGLWPAFWLLGSSAPWPDSGELDVLEVPYQAAAPLIGSAVHLPWQDPTRSGHYVQDGFLAGRWPLAGPHTYTVDWLPDAVIYRIDGVVTHRHDRAACEAAGARWSLTGPAFVVLNLAVGGWAGTPPADATYPATMYVHWVRAYSL